MRNFIKCYRPPLDQLENSFDFVRDCLIECWCEIPENRPDFKSIRNKLRPLRKGMWVGQFLLRFAKNNSLKNVLFRKSNIFDNMMAMMEKYANNLEVLVDERTDQLSEEKKKTGLRLLFENVGFAKANDYFWLQRHCCTKCCQNTLQSSWSVDTRLKQKVSTV